MANRSVKRLQAILAQLPKDVKQPILSETIRQAEILRRAMIFLVPLGTSGKLRDTIITERSDRSEMRVLVRAGGPLTTHGGYDYANAAEFGTQFLPARPFFWPAYRKRKASIRRELKIVARLTINRNWKP